MFETTALMFEIGVIMLIAFMGATIASRFRLSAIIGYIVAGILIGPHFRFSLAGVAYQGVITDDAFIQDISRIGLILLLFFVGLEFSIAKLKRTKQAAAVLALVNLGAAMFGGFVPGTYLGWPLIDTIFLAGVVSMSSSAIAAKSDVAMRRPAATCSAISASLTSTTYERPAMMASTLPRSTSIPVTRKPARANSSASGRPT